MSRRVIPSLLLICLVGVSCGRPLPPSPPPAQFAPVPPPQLGEIVPMQVCTMQDGQLVTITAMYATATGDTSVNGRPFREAYPPTAEHANGASWFINRELVVFRGHNYVGYGLPRLLGPGDVIPIGTYQGVPVFAEPEADRARPEVLYFPVTPQCEFQPYQGVDDVGAVRG